MKFTPIEPHHACWRLAYTFCDFYPPEESVQSCLDGLDADDDAGRRQEEWYHNQRSEVYRKVIEYLYKNGIDVWAYGQEHVQSGDHPESAQADLELPDRPEVVHVPESPPTQANPRDVLQDAIDGVVDNVVAAADMDSQLLWMDVLTDISNESHSEMHQWLETTGEQAQTRKRVGQRQVSTETSNRI